MPKEFSNSIEQVIGLCPDRNNVSILLYVPCDHARRPAASPVIHNCNGSTVCHVHVPIKRILCLDIVNHIDQRGSGGLRPYLQIRPRPSVALRGIFCKLLHNPGARQMTMQLLPRSKMGVVRRCKGVGVIQASWSA